MYLLVHLENSILSKSVSFSSAEMNLVHFESRFTCVTWCPEKEMWAWGEENGRLRVGTMRMRKEQKNEKMENVGKKNEINADLGGIDLQDELHGLRDEESEAVGWKNTTRQGIKWVKWFVCFERQPVRHIVFLAGQVWILESILLISDEACEYFCG